MLAGAAPYPPALNVRRRPPPVRVFRAPSPPLGPFSYGNFPELLCSKPIDDSTPDVRMQFRIVSIIQSVPDQIDIWTPAPACYLLFLLRCLSGGPVDNHFGLCLFDAG